MALAAGAMGALGEDPSGKNQVFIELISDYYGAVKDALMKEGTVAPHYVILAEKLVVGVPPLTDDAVRKAREVGAEAIVTVEGFHMDTDIGDLLYHVNISAPTLGVLGWVCKVRLGDEKAVVIREMPYLFDSPDKVRSLGELVDEMERLPDE